jgi:uncharacterized protein YndB with AHSA1/START domain
MTENLVAKASTTVNAPSEDVWHALVDPQSIKDYMFGTEVVSDWRQGSAITWKGEWKGKKYVDKGVILTAEPRRELRYSHFSTLSGLPDRPENYHTVTIRLAEDGTGTTVSLSQDKNPNEDAKRHSEENWQRMLDALKKLVEGRESLAAKR